jgi:hypothetical protein
MSLVAPTTTTLVPASQTSASWSTSHSRVCGSFHAFDDDQRRGRLVLIGLDGGGDAADADLGRGARQAAVLTGAFGGGQGVLPLGEDVDGDARNRHLGGVAALIVGAEKAGWAPATSSPTGLKSPPQDRNRRGGRGWGCGRARPGRRAA